MSRSTYLSLSWLLFAGLFGCNKEECEEIIPKKVAERLLADGKTCKDVESLAWAAAFGLYQVMCKEQLLADPEYRWHCGELGGHNHFSSGELDALCMRGFDEFIARCHTQGRRLSRETIEVELETGINHSSPGYSFD